MVAPGLLLLLQKCSVLNDQGLPPRADSEYKDDLRAYGADRYVPTDAALSNLMAETKQMCSMLKLLISRLPAATPAPPPATPAAPPTPRQQDIAHAKQRCDEKAAFDAGVEAAVARINANASHVAHGAAQERPCAQDKDNAQYLEQENDGLRIQAGTKPDYTVAAWPGEFPEPGQPTAIAVAAAEPETGVFCEHEMDTTAAAQNEIFAVALQDHYISKSTAADAPTGSTLNKPEWSRARSRPARARTRTPSAPRTSTSPSTPAPRSRLAPSLASGLTTRSALRILLAEAFGPSFLYAGQTERATL